MSEKDARARAHPIRSDRDAEVAGDKSPLSRGIDQKIGRESERLAGAVAGEPPRLSPAENRHVRPVKERNSRGLRLAYEKSVEIRAKPVRVGVFRREAGRDKQLI